ncbi:MAG: methyltransferase domain-containing protein [candidate division Zixibacteria bacterium]|nr:methyltransferase domain-containing protein [candidate division Zixibacteria bacterium]MDD5427407.1 methyltransferase domain-containing protein [candidate division Zixibacteria bacterium]
MTLQEENQYTFDFEEVFNVDDYLYFYEDYLTEEINQKQVQFLVRELELNRPLRILDLACGHGRHANRLAQLDHEVTGVDLTSGFLEIARRDAAGRNLKVTYIQKDMRQISFHDEFDRVLFMFTAIGYFTDEDNFKVLRNISRSLKPGGLVCLDTINRDNLLKNFRSHIITDKGEDLMLDRNSFDSATGYIHDRRTIIRNGHRKDFKFSIRLYNPSEIKLILEQAGLKVIKTFGSWDSQKLTGDAWRMIIIAEKE